MKSYNEMIKYFDSAANMPTDTDGLFNSIEAYKQYDYNPSATYLQTNGVKQLMTNAVSLLFPDTPHKQYRCVFTSGGTESNNLAIQSIAYSKGGDPSHILCDSSSHKSMLEPVRLGRSNYTMLPVSGSGLIDTEELKRLITENTQLVCVCAVNNETGVIQPIPKIAEIVKKHNPNCLLLVDAVQAYTKIPNNAIMCDGVDMISITGHKIGAVGGIGALIVHNRAWDKVQPFIFGGGQQYGKRAGTENMFGIVNLISVAAKMHSEYNRRLDYITALNEKFCKKLFKSPTTAKIRFNGNRDFCTPYILSLSIEGVNNDNLQYLLSVKGFSVGIGSACNSYKNTSSHVLKAMGLEDRANSTIRVSFSAYNTLKSAEELASEIAKQVKILQDF